MIDGLEEWEAAEAVKRAAEFERTKDRINAKSEAEAARRQAWTEEEAEEEQEE